jgi:hypothetical protein
MQHERRGSENSKGRAGSGETVQKVGCKWAWSILTANRQCEEKGNNVALPRCADTTPVQMIVIVINILQQICGIAVWARVNVPRLAGCRVESRPESDS